MDINLGYYNDYLSFSIRVVEEENGYVGEVYSYTGDFGSDYAIEKTVYSLTKEGALLKAEMWVDNH